MDGSMLLYSFACCLAVSHLVFAVVVLESAVLACVADAGTMLHAEEAELEEE